MFINNRIADDTDQDRRDEDQFPDFVVYDRFEHRGHGEGGQHDGVAVHEDGVVDVADQAGDVEERRYSQDTVSFAGLDDLELAELVALGDDVVVGEHDCFGEAGGS